MKLTLKAYTIYELGQRANQEDAIFPKHGAVQEVQRRAGSDPRLLHRWGRNGHHQCLPDQVVRRERCLIPKGCRGFPPAFILISYLYNSDTITRYNR